jgi:hypothetical protein
MKISLKIFAHLLINNSFNLYSCYGYKKLFMKIPHNFIKKQNTNTCFNTLLRGIKTNLLTTKQGGITVDIREGLIPTALGTAVTAAGYALKQTRGTNKMIANTVFGFGLAHVVLGVIDLVEHRR